MRSHTPRLWLLALLSVVAVGWSQLPSLSAQAPAEHRVVYGAGASSQGQLGITAVTVAPPRALGQGAIPFEDVLDAAVGNAHTLVLRADRTVWAYGSNMVGQLGTASPGGPVPQQVAGLPPVVNIAAGDDFSFAIDENGQLWAWGNHASGQLGIGPIAPPFTGTNIPTLVALPAAAVDVAGGLNFAVAALADGTLWAWGDNLALQLGTPSPSMRNVPGPVEMPPSYHATRVAAGQRTALALDAQGALIGWGDNVSRQIGPAGNTLLVGGPIISNVRAMDVGSGHIVVALNDGRVLTRGAGGMGQLGTGSTNSSPTFVQVPGITDAIDVAAGASHTVAVTGAGAMRAWGLNTARQLGTASTDPVVLSPQQVVQVPLTGRSAEAGFNSTVFLLAPGAVRVTADIPLNWSCTGAFPLEISAAGFNSVTAVDTDVVLVLDESGSIQAPDFEKLRQFAMNFVNAQTISPADTRVGVVMFDTTARKLIDISSSKLAVTNALGGVTQRRGTTCIGCGLKMARDLLITQGRPGANRAIIVVTDGVTTPALDEDFAETVPAVQQQSTVFAIGVGAQVDPSQIAFIASDIPGVQTSFLTTDFDGLTDVLTALSVTVGPALQNVTVTFTVAGEFELAGPLNRSAGSVQVSNGNRVSWTIPTLGSTPATFTTSLRGRGQAGGQLPVFTEFTSSAFSSGVLQEQQHEIPATLIVGCPASIVLDPPTATQTVGLQHLFRASVRDHSGAHVSVPITVNIVSGPNAGRTFQATPLGSEVSFLYSSAQAGVDELVATIPNSPITATATVIWEPPNTAPMVDAGADLPVALSGSTSAAFTLTAIATDDGKQAPLTYEWREGSTVVGDTLSLTVSRPAGVYTFTFTAHDGELSSSDAVIVTVSDLSAPVITHDIAGTAGANGWYISPVTVSFAASDPETAITSPACAPSSFSGDGAGQTAQCSATSSGGTATSSVSVDIDQVPPVVTPPGAVVADATSAAGATVAYSGEAATDATSGIVTFSCLPASNTMFTIGTTTVTCTATDAAGHSTVATSTVTVRDPTAPIVTPTVTGPLGANGWYTGDVAISWTAVDAETGPPSTNGCGSVTMNTDGTASFTCSATSAGGTTSQSVTVTRDATAPVVTPPAHQSVDAESSSGADVTYPPATAQDPVSGVTGAVTCTPASGSAFPIGTTTVTCSATNGAGLTGSATFTVTVTDRTEPGEMYGQGDVRTADNHSLKFNFVVLESRRGFEWGDVDIKVKELRRRGGDIDRFDARTVDDVRFTNSPDYGPGRNSHTGVDTVQFSGTGKWEGRSGYRYVVSASDRGEPGRGRDTFTIQIVKISTGEVVFSGGGTLSDGNVQSTRLQKPWWWWTNHRDRDDDRGRGRGRGNR